MNQITEKDFTAEERDAIVSGIQPVADTLGPSLEQLVEAVKGVDQNQEPDNANS